MSEKPKQDKPQAQKHKAPKPIKSIDCPRNDLLKFDYKKVKEAFPDSQEKMVNLFRSIDFYLGVAFTAITEKVKADPTFKSNVIEGHKQNEVLRQKFCKQLFAEIEGEDKKEGENPIQDDFPAMEDILKLIKPTIEANEGKDKQKVVTLLKSFLSVEKIDKEAKDKQEQLLSKAMEIEIVIFGKQVAKYMRNIYSVEPQVQPFVANSIISNGNNLTRFFVPSIIDKAASESKVLILDENQKVKKSQKPQAPNPKDEKPKPKPKAKKE